MGECFLEKSAQKTVNFIENCIFTGDEIYIAELNNIIDKPTLLNIDRGEPRNYKQVVKLPDWEKWKKVMNDKLEGLKECRVYEEVERPKGKNVVGSKWVYKIKLGPKGEISRYKARLVAQGFSQVKGLNFNETFTPVARLTSIRSILSFAVKRGLKVYQLDIDQTYLYGDLKEEIYMEQPHGFETRNNIW